MMKHRQNLKSFALAALLAAAGLTVSATSAFADFSCTYTLQAVQTESDGKVLVRFSNGTWHLVASASNPSVSDRLSVALAAYLSGRKLYLRLSSGSCSTSDYGTEPSKVRITD